MARPPIAVSHAGMRLFVGTALSRGPIASGKPTDGLTV